METLLASICIVRINIKEDTDMKNNKKFNYEIIIKFYLVLTNIITTSISTLLTNNASQAIVLYR